MKEFLVKIQNYSVHAATLLLRLFITDTFCNMYRKIAFLKNNILSKSLSWTSFMIKLQPFSTQLSVL